MMKMIKFYIKDNLLSLIITTVIATAIAVCVVATNKLVYSTYYSENCANKSVFSFFIVLLITLSIAIPISLLIFKMKKIGIDKYYSLPVKKNILYLAKYISGLILMFVPYFISFLFSFIIILIRENIYNYGYIWLLFIILLLCAICMYTIVFFTIYCQNTMVDGIIIVGFVIVILPMIISTANFFYNSICGLVGSQKYSYFSGAWNYSLLSPLINSYNIITNKIAGEIVSVDANQIISFILLFGCAVLAVFAFLFKSKYEKAEDTLERSNSWFGYKLFVPIIAAFLIALLPYIYGWIVGVSCLYVGLVIYRRSFKLDRASWITTIVFAACALLYIIIL